MILNKPSKGLKVAVLVTFAKAINRFLRWKTIPVLPF